MFPMQASISPGPVSGQDKIRRMVLLRSLILTFHNNRQKNSPTPADFEKHKGM